MQKQVWVPPMYNIIMPTWAFQPLLEIIHLTHFVTINIIHETLIHLHKIHPDFAKLDCSKSHLIPMCT
jgi:hypothetical protein